MVFNHLACRLDTIHITITRPRSVIGFVGENGEPTDKLFYGVLDILAGKNYEIRGGSKKFVNNGSEYIQSNNKEIIVQLRSSHLMKNGNSKVEAILKFLKANDVSPKIKRSRKKDDTKERQKIFYQFSRLDFAVDYETSFDLLKIIAEKIGYSRFFQGIHKDYFYRVIHGNKRTSDGGREHRIKEIKLGNLGFELAIYNKKLEIAEAASSEKLALYPLIYRDILSAPSRQLYRVELRFFRSRSIAFNGLTADELTALPAKELSKFGTATKLIKIKPKDAVESSLFSRLFTIKNPVTQKGE